MAISNSLDSTPMELSETPLSMTEGLDALMGLEASVEEPEAEQAEEEGPSEDVEETPEDQSELEEEEEVVEEEVEEDSQEDDSEQALELSDEDYTYLSGIKDWAEAQGFTDVEQLRSGVLMQSDYTQKTQEHARAVAEWSEQSAKQTQDLAQALELAQAVLYGQEASFDAAALQELKSTDPIAYEQKLEDYVSFQARKKEVDEQIAKATEEHNAQLGLQRAATIEEQSKLFVQMVPDAADPSKAADIQKTIADYWVGLGGEPEILNGITGAMELKVLYDAAKNTSLAKEVSKAKTKKPKAAKRYIKSGSPQSKTEKKTASRKSKLDGLSKAKTTSEARKSGEDLIFDMLNNGEL
jgi:hypothetical protein